MKREIAQTAVITVILLLLLATCQQQDSPDSGDSLPGSALDGTTWSMTSMAKSRPLPGAEVTAGFMNGEMSGSTGCNTYFYSYKIAGQRLILEGGGVTEMACMQPEGVMEQETRFLNFLNQVDRYVLTEDGLQLITPDGEHLIFVPRP